MHQKIRQVYGQGPAIKSCFLFAVFTFKVELWIVLKFKRREYHETKQNGSTRITRYGFGFVALRETSFRRHFFFSVLDTRLDQILPRLILCPSKSFKPCTEKKNLMAEIYLLLHDMSVYPPNMESFTLMIVTVGPLPSQLLWNVDAAQPSVLACQHFTNLLHSELRRTGSR